MEENNCRHEEIRIIEGYRENHSCWYEDYPSYAECIKCGYIVTDEYSYKKYNDFIKGKIIIIYGKLKHEINIP